MGSQTADCTDEYHRECAYNADVIICSIDDNYSAIFHHHVLHGLSETDDIKGTIHRVGNGENDPDGSTKFWTQHSRPNFLNAGQFSWNFFNSFSLKTYMTKYVPPEQGKMKVNAHMGKN